MPGKPLITSPRELVLVTRRHANVKTLLDGRVTSDPAFDVSEINKLLEFPEFELKPLFGLTEDRLRIEADKIERETGVRPPDLTVFKRFYAPDHLLDELAERLNRVQAIAAAYVKPGVRPPLWFTDMDPDTSEPAHDTPDFMDRQGYLRPAKDGGIDAFFAWDQIGGRGAGVKIIDIEGAWRFNHDDLKENQGGTVAGKDKADDRLRNHGTAVLGIFSGDRNKRGITGICSDANVCGVSVFEVRSVMAQGWGTAAAIRDAGSRLCAGDILLLELQRAGPSVQFHDQSNQLGEIPVEWWPCDFAAIQTATIRKILVVTPGGNGQQDLGSAIFDTPPPTLASVKFPSEWQNPFRRPLRDSGSIIVGAGAPRKGSVAELCRLDFSNFDETNKDSIFDAQAWGENVTTTGFGNLPDGAGQDEDFWYTGIFSGTSSAAPMVAGVLGCLQGIRKAQKKAPLTPAQARDFLRTTGVEQGDSPQSPRSKRIGNRPDLQALIAKLATLP
jgi:subtilisin family serine protease